MLMGSPCTSSLKLIARVFTISRLCRNAVKQPVFVHSLWDNRHATGDSDTRHATGDSWHSPRGWWKLTLTICPSTKKRGVRRFFEAYLLLSRHILLLRHTLYLWLIYYRRFDRIVRRSKICRRNGSVVRTDIDSFCQHHNHLLYRRI